jgi:hypothetical protein
LSFGQFLLHQPQEYAMGLALSRTDDNNMSTLHHIYAKDKSFIRQHNARKGARRLSKSMIGKPSNFKVCCFVLWLGHDLRMYQDKLTVGTVAHTSYWFW